MSSINMSELKELIEEAVAESHAGSKADLEKKMLDLAEKAIRNDSRFKELMKTGPNKMLGMYGEETSFANGNTPNKGRIGASYKELFGGENLADEGFKSLDDVLDAINRGHDSRLKTLVTSEGSGAGFLIPDVYRQQLYDLALEESIVKKRALVYSLKAGLNMKVPAYADTNRSTDGIAGVKATYTPEATDATQDDPAFRMIDLKINKLSCFTKTSSELLEDSGIPLSETIAYVFASVISDEEDWQYINGTGAGRPLGVLNSDCLITIAEEDAQSPGELAYQNIYKIFAQFMPQSYKTGIWLASISLIPSLMTLSQPIGLAGERIRIMREGKPGQFTLLGLPLYFTSKVPTQNSAGALGLYDFSKYAILQKSDFRMAKSEHAQFQAGITQWKAEIRHDGQPIMNSTLTTRDSNVEVSPFVVLGAVT